MKLIINNFAKIKEADIIVDGITVIAGENNTGKSTVGKILFSLFNSMSDISKKIFEEQLNEIESINEIILRNLFADLDISGSRFLRTMENAIESINFLLKRVLNEKQSISDEEICTIVETAILTTGDIPYDPEDKFFSDIVRTISENIRDILNVPEKTITLEIITRYFNEIFHYQIQPLWNGEESETSVSVDIKGKKIKLFFENNICADYIVDTNIIQKSIYIDNPFIVDELSKYNMLNPMDDLLKTSLKGKNEGGMLDGVIETVRTKEKLKSVYKTLQSVIDGEIILDQNSEFYLKENSIDGPIAFYNLSTGMKSFVILKRLLERGALKEKDVLILDEPEIHLHPQWQIAYAELIVLLQKSFDLSVVVATHSPYFVDAINLFSCKYETDGRTNYYLSSNGGNGIRMECVTENIDLIYKKMASPIQMLDTLRYELNHN